MSDGTFLTNVGRNLISIMNTEKKTIFCGHQLRCYYSNLNIPIIKILCVVFTSLNQNKIVN